MVKMINDVVTTVQAHCEGVVCVWASCESWELYPRFLGSLTWPVTMVNKHFTQSPRVIDIQITTPVFIVNGHLASAWIPPVTNVPLLLNCALKCSGEKCRCRNHMKNTTADCFSSQGTSPVLSSPSILLHQFPSALGFDFPFLLKNVQIEGPSQWGGCIGVLQRGRKCIYVKRISYGNWLMWLWRPRSPQFAICKRETLERWWCNLVQIWKPENLGSLFLNPSVWRPEN